MFLPRPELRADEEDDRDVQAVEFSGKGEIHVGEVDEHGGVGPGLAAKTSFELAILAVNAGHVADNFGDSHYRHVFGPNDAIQAGRLHALAAQPKERRVRREGADRMDQERAVMLSARLARGEKDTGASEMGGKGRIHLNRCPPA